MSAKGSELKRVRQSRKGNSYNNHYKSMMKTSIKKVQFQVFQMLKIHLGKKLQNYGLRAQHMTC